MKYFLLDQTDDIAILALNQPQVMNSFSMEVQNEFMVVLDDLEKNESIHGLIITGAGKAFAAGADIKQMSRMNATDAIAFSKLGNTVFNRIEKLKMITVAAINGAALGGGCELALVCDYRIAAAEAKIGQPEINLGIIPGWGSCRRLAHLVGMPAARDLIFSGKVITCEEALQIKLVDQVVAPDVLIETAMNLLQKLLRNSPLILQYAKEVLQAGSTLSPEQAESKENELFCLCFESQDQKEGMNAFLEKRKPNFKGE
jgi:enoyl-CoA hydratase